MDWVLISAAGASWVALAFGLARMPHGSRRTAVLLGGAGVVLALEAAALALRFG